MTRYPAWESNLEVFLATNRDRTFAYGEWDCFQFTRGAVLAMTGVDLAAEFRSYTSRLGYLLQMRRYCGAFALLSFANRLMASVGAKEVALPFARRGDLAVSIDSAFGLVAMNGRELLMLTESGALGRVPMHQAMRVWRI